MVMIIYSKTGVVGRAVRPLTPPPLNARSSAAQVLNQMLADVLIRERALTSEFNARLWGAGQSRPTNVFDLSKLLWHPLVAGCSTLPPSHHRSQTLTLFRMHSGPSFIVGVTF